MWMKTLIGATLIVAGGALAPAHASSDRNIGAVIASMPDDVLAQNPVRRFEPTGPVRRPAVVRPGPRGPVVVQQRRRSNAGAIAAGAALGIAGAAIVGGALTQPGYAAEEPVYVAPRRRVVVEDPYAEEVIVQRRCWVEQRPVVDQWGEVVGYRNRRVCR